jgi:putative glutamine amidotransferase
MHAESQMDGRRPLVAIPACRRFLPPHPFHVVGEKYVTAVLAAARAVPVLVPALGGALPLADLLGRIDGLVLTGSPSNVEPHHYAGAASREGTLHDPHRDATTLPLVRAALAAGMPVLAICRGFQEVNVALGGTLHQNVHELPGMLDHREVDDADLEQRYAAAHAIRLAPGGMLERLAGRGEVLVNSLHAQGVDRLADGLAVEATAPDGLVEAYRLANTGQFLLAVQWHPEWRVLDDPFSVAIFESFGAACRRFAGSVQHERHSELV